jgi:protein-disulfide isomerase
VLPIEKTFLLRTWHCLIAVAAVTLTVGSATGQDTSKDTSITRGQADAILNELKQIRQLLERQQANSAPPPQPVSGKLKDGGEFALGSKDAPVTMIEFTDYECPFCRQFESTTFSEIRKQLIDTGKLRVIVRNMPLPMHSHAIVAAQAAFCAGDQGQFWECMKHYSALTRVLRAKVLCKVRANCRSMPLRSSPASMEGNTFLTYSRTCRTLRRYNSAELRHS